ncbi:Cro/CI family transcriptional regulator [Pseudomonas helleri]|uniref:Cro/CI family transcriptional regulator n=1 Tax=Pseudomonas helleri TaxID=1608996 RepID=UPI0009E1B829|nr:Cro/CI family transcriptional regulator [Pseudomonas helleri]
MNQFKLPDLVVQKGQASVAEALGISPAAIHKALRSGRQIIVTIHEDGSYTAQELRPFPSQKTLHDPKAIGRCITPERVSAQSMSSRLT